MQAVLEIINRECMNLYRACALLDCLRVAAMHDGYEEEVETGDVAYVARGLVSDVFERARSRGATEGCAPAPTGAALSGSLATEKPGMDKKLFKRLTKSMRQHAKIARGELPPSRVTSRDSSDDMARSCLRPSHVDYPTPMLDGSCP